MRSLGKAVKILYVISGISRKAGGSSCSSRGLIAALCEARMGVGLSAGWEGAVDSWRAQNPT